MYHERLHFLISSIDAAAYALQKHVQRFNIRVNTFDPGLVPGTGLARNYPSFLKFISDYVFKALILFHPNVHTAKQ